MDRRPEAHAQNDRRLAVTLSVVTLQFGELPYFADSSAVNAAYCARHGLRWSICPAVPATDRHPVWSKVRILAEEIERSPFALFLDADAVFVDHSFDPRRLIGALGGKALLLERDASGQANTGIMLARAGATARAILEEWRSVPERDSTHAFRWPLEQGAFNRHVVGRHSHAIELVRAGELSSIRHYAARRANEKARQISLERAILECR